MTSQQQTLPTDDRNTMLYLLVLIQSAAAAISILLLIALTIPLVIQLKNGSFQMTIISRRGSQPAYSTYNLYLVYLAIADLAYLLPNAVANWMSANGKYYPRFYSTSLLPGPPPNIDTSVPPICYILSCPYIVANLWINAVVAYQVLILLQKSQRAQRVTQPSLTRVNMQGGGVLFGCVLFGAVNYYQMVYGWADDKVFTSIADSILVFVPFIYVFGLTFLVKWRGYMPAVNGSTPRDRAVRGLALYFLRVTVVFLVIWLPCVMLYTVFVYNEIEKQGHENYSIGLREQLVGFLASFLASIQPIVTFCMILTKPDVKKYIKDLVTLSYLSGGYTCCRCGKAVRTCCRSNKVLPEEANENMDTDLPEIAIERSCHDNSYSILGYNFSEEDVEANGDAEQDIETDINTVGDSVDDLASMINGDSENGNDYDNGKDDDQVEVDIADDVETGIPKYKSRRIRGGPAVVLATGETVSIDVKNPVAVTAVPYTISDVNVGIEVGSHGGELADNTNDADIDSTDDETTN